MTIFWISTISPNGGLPSSFVSCHQGTALCSDLEEVLRCPFRNKKHQKTVAAGVLEASETFFLFPLEDSNAIGESGASSSEGAEGRKSKP